MIDEFLIRFPEFIGKFHHLRMKPQQSNVLLHGHCYQKSRPPADDGQPTGVNATKMMLEISGYQVEIVDSGCCGMAGGFGYEKEHYDISMRIGEFSLFPAIRNAVEKTIIAASGVSCQSQIVDGTNKTAVHPITLVAKSMENEIKY